MELHRESIFFYGSTALMIAFTYSRKKQPDLVDEGPLSLASQVQAHCVETDMLRVDSSLTIPISKSFLELPKYGDLCGTGKTLTEMTLRLGAVSAVVLLASTALQHIDL